MTQKDTKKIAQALKHYFSELKIADEYDNFNPNEYLLDEICFAIEDCQADFNEIAFRQEVLNL